MGKKTPRVPGLTPCGGGSGAAWGAEKDENPAALTMSTSKHFSTLKTIFPHPPCVGLLDLCPIPLPTPSSFLLVRHCMPTSALGAGRPLVPFWAAASPARNSKATSALGAGRPLVPFWAATFSKILPEAEKLNVVVRNVVKNRHFLNTVSVSNFCKKNSPRFARQGKKFSPRFARKGKKNSPRFARKMSFLFEGGDNSKLW